MELYFDLLATICRLDVWTVWRSCVQVIRKRHVFRRTREKQILSQSSPPCPHHSLRRQWIDQDRLLILLFLIRPCSADDRSDSDSDSNDKDLQEDYIFYAVISTELLAPIPDWIVLEKRPSL